MRDSNLKTVFGVLILAASLGAAGCAVNGRGDGASATAARTPPSEADLELAARVQYALHADPYFYDKHVTVSVENGAVVLRGFVLSSGDLINAKRIASNAAGGRPVVDDLAIRPDIQPTPGERH